MAIALLAIGCLVAVIAVGIALIYIAQLHRRMAVLSKVRRLDRRVRALERQSFPVVSTAKRKDWIYL